MPHLMRTAPPDASLALRNWAKSLGIDFEETVIERALRDFTSEYNATLYELMNDNIGGKITPQEMAKAHRTLLRDIAPRIYEEGLRLIGVDEMDEDDENNVKGWIAGQLGYVNDFARSGNADGILMWTKALGSLGKLAKSGAETNSMVTWTFNPAKDHCVDNGGKRGCASLHGTRHRLKWFISRGLIPQEVGSETITCGGWQCGCVCKNDNGKRIL